MGNERGQIEVPEQISLARAYRLCNLVCLFGLLSQLLHLGDEHLIAAIGVSISASRAEDLPCIILHQAPEVFREDLHAVRIDELVAC